jgi:hypothetical protein
VSRKTEHWLATSHRYSVDELDARIVRSADEAEEHRADGWRVEGPFVPAEQLREAAVRAERAEALLKRLYEWDRAEEKGKPEDYDWLMWSAGRITQAHEGRYEWECAGCGRAVPHQSGHVHVTSENPYVTHPTRRVGVGGGTG